MSGSGVETPLPGTFSFFLFFLNLQLFGRALCRKNVGAAGKEPQYVAVCCSVLLGGPCVCGNWFVGSFAAGPQ